MNRKHFSRSLLLILLLSYWAVSLRHLTIVPAVYEDEPWIASSGWKLSREGIFGSDLFAGFYGMEEANYGYLPVYSILAAAVFKLTGLGLFQVRFEPVVFGLLTLALTYALGKRLFRPSVGLLAVFLLLFTRTTGLTASQYSGILLLDTARIARYDIAVPFFGLTALLLFASRLGRDDAAAPFGIFYFPLLGILTALSSLSHLYGLFWFVALLFLHLLHKSSWPRLIGFGLGFLLPWAFYLAFIVSGWSHWLGQSQIFSNRFDLLDPGWYWHNLINEFQRYGPGLGEGSLFRIGFWTAVIVIPLSLFVLGRQAIQGDKKAQTLFVPTLVLPALFALLIYIKLSNYLVTAAPLFALVMAWGLLKFWRYGQEFQSSTHVYLKGFLRFVVPLLLLTIAFEGTARWLYLEQRAETTTPYETFTVEIQSHLPPDGRILALHHYWLNFQNWDYRSWYVPLGQSNPEFLQPPVSMEEALNDIDPTIILIDPRLRVLFEDEPQIAESVFNWMAQQGFEQTAVVQDQTYGQIDIYLQPDD